MDIELIKRRLLIKYPLFGSILANANFIVADDIDTAATDGKDIYYNPRFIEKLNIDEQVFVFAHEVCHIAFDHIFRSENKEDKELWNTATDAVINAFLVQDGLPMIKGAVDISEAINYDAEELYNKLLEKKKSEQNKVSNNNNADLNSGKKDGSEGQNLNNNKTTNQTNQNTPNTSSNSNSDNQIYNDVGHDTHSMWSKAIEKKHQEEKKEDNSNSNVEDKKNSEEKSSTEVMQNTKKEEKNVFTKIGEKETFKQNKIERKKQLEELRKDLASKSHGFGNSTDSEIRIINDIGISKPLIDWRRLLREAIKHDVDWSYRNASIEDGVLTPHLEKISIPETEIVLDTSATVSDTLLRNFLRECKNILQTSKVKIGCFDTKFYGFTEINDISDIDNLVFYGRGGTNFNVAVNAFTRRTENKIIFTDGDAAMPEMAIDAIWIVYGNKRIKPKGGKVIYINNEQLNKLSNFSFTDENKGKIRR